MKTTRLIGQRWKCGNVCSLLILIGRGLDLRREWMLKFKVTFRMCSFEGVARNAERRRSESEEEAKTRDRETTEDFRWLWLEGSPVPIPNTEVKPPRADGTWLDTARESRSLPDSTIRRRRHLRITYSSVAQWQSTRLLTELL